MTIAVLAIATGALSGRDGTVTRLLADALSRIAGIGVAAGERPEAIDGDTFKVQQGNELVTVRVALIDAGESSRLRYGRPTCGGRQARKFARRWARNRHELELRRVSGLPRTDRYDRRLARLVDRRGDDYGSAVVRRGWARVVVYEKPRGLGAAYLLQLRGAQAQARRKGRGGWTACRW
ncbi:MAG: thermonuclease family protein [Actinomycetota bacterium]|nr:thermonuclease family protein [Actinomycetota bacterium]